MKKELIIIFLSLSFLVACDNNEIKEEPLTEPPRTTFKFVYTGEHYVKDFNVYVGPKGERIEAGKSLASHFWGEYSLLGSPYYDTLIIDTVNNKMKVRTNLTLKIKLSGDTIYDGNYDNDYPFEYYGKIVNDTTFIMNRAHYFINYVGREVGHSIYPWIGEYGYHRYHKVANTSDMFHSNSRFGSFSDMVLTSDTLAWLTEYYEFKLVESY